MPSLRHHLASAPRAPDPALKERWGERGYTAQCSALTGAGGVGRARRAVPGDRAQYEAAQPLSVTDTGELPLLPWGS